MANCVLVPTKITAMDVDAYNRVGVNTTVAIPNGTPLTCGVTVPPATNAQQGEVFQVTVPNSIVKNVWMAYSPEVVITQSGTLQFMGIDVDPRDFTNVVSRPFDMFRPNPGVDMIQVTKEFFNTGADPDSVAGATVVELNAAGGFDAKAAATADYAGIAFRIVKKDPIIIASGILGGEQVPAWVLECTAN